MVSQRPDRRVIVGIDGSKNAQHALRWALDKASVLGRVTPAVVYQLPVPPLLGRVGEDHTAYREAAEAQLREAIDTVDPSLRSAGLVIEGHPGAGLVEAASDADLLVVGTRGQSGLQPAVLGSVSSYCATSASVPVVIVPGDCPVDRALAEVVVGVDGSPEADAALRWAIEHLAPGGCLRAVGALPIWGDTSNGSRSVEERLGDRVEASVERVLADLPPVSADHREIVITTASRDARVALREAASDGADLLVIGRRGLSRLAFLVVGSVAAALTHHPDVPTVVIPAVDHS